MKRQSKKIIFWAAIAAIAMLAQIPSIVFGETIVSVTQYSYDARFLPVCTTVRMNPAVYGSLPTNACSQGTAGTYGPDRITQNVYDAAGQLFAFYQGVGTSDIRQYARYTYTNNGLKWTERDANNNLTLFDYDGFDRLQRVAYPTPVVGSGSVNNSDYEYFSYDANGNRTAYRHRNGQTVLYTYDNLNREVLKDLPAYAGSTATSKDIYTGYDGLGHVLYKRFGSASGPGVSYTYDGLGRVWGTTDMNGRSIWYGYNANSTRSFMVYPDNVAQYYYYDNDGKMNWTGIADGSVAYAPHYDSLRRLSFVQRSNGTYTYYGYDGVGRVTAITLDLGGTAYDVDWHFKGYNPAGQITSWDASTSVYDYVETATSAENRTYDGLNRDAAIAAVSGGYDSAGNMANDGPRVFTYDVENRLLTGSGTLAGLAMEYDPEGRLYRYTYNGTERDFLYDGTNLIGEYDSSGNMLQRYMHTLGTDQPWVQFAGTSTAATNAVFPYSNYQGSIIAQADSAGTVAKVYKYGPYGEPRNDANAEDWSGNRFRYTGQVALRDAKLYYYKARVYDPTMGRFLQTDPIGSKDDLDLYAYVGGDPVNRSDPTGLTCEQVQGGSYKCHVDRNGDEDGKHKMSDRQIQRIEAGYTKSVNKMMSHPNRSTTVTVDGKSFKATAGDAAKKLIGATVTANSNKPADRVADTFGGAMTGRLPNNEKIITIYGTQFNSDAQSGRGVNWTNNDIQNTFAHESLHTLPGESVMRGLNPAAFAQDHGDPYNKSADELLGN